MRHHKFSLFLIALIIFVGVIIDMPLTNLFSISIPKLPGINRSFNLTLPFGGSVIFLNYSKFKFIKIFQFREGLDLAGGTSITLSADMKNIAITDRDNALNAAKTVISNRINLLGVSEPTIQTAKDGSDYRLIVDLPGVGNQEALSVIGSTAELSFWESGIASNSGILPVGMIQVLGNTAELTNLTGKDLKSASVTYDSNTGQPQVNLIFNNSGTQKFANLTTKNIKKPIAIVLDNQVIEAPVVQQPILTGNAVITGNFTQDTANNLAIELQAGTLPVPLHVLSEQTIGATLGQNSLNESIFAGLVGFIIVAIFMIALYKKSGVIATVALIIYTIMALAIFKMIPITLTLSGIAGFILSVGMAVDANILIFERTKEELRRGRNHEQAQSLGFSRAWSSIRDSNISTLITCLILFRFGEGIVKGFALTLAIGVGVSMFSAIFVTRTLLNLFNK